MSKPTKLIEADLTPEQIAALNALAEAAEARDVAEETWRTHLRTVDALVVQAEAVKAPRGLTALAAGVSRQYLHRRHGPR